MMGVKTVKQIIIYTLLAIVITLVLFPIYWMTTTSFKLPTDYITRSLKWIPPRITLSHYQNLWEHKFSRYFLNTLVISLSSTLLATVTGSLAAYSLVRFKFPAKFGQLFLLWALIVKMVPPIVIAIPLYVILRRIGLINTRLGLIITYQIYALPYCIWMMLGFFRDLPVELEEAAATDGASRMKILQAIVLPLVAPGLVAAGIFSLIMTWNEFIYALLYLRSPDVFTLPIHVANYITEYETLWGELSAAGILSSLPVLAFSGYVQKYLIRGFTMGGLK